MAKKKKAEEAVEETVEVKVKEQIVADGAPLVEDVNLKSTIEELAEKPEPVIAVVEPKASTSGVKKVKVKFLKNLTPRVLIAGDWIEGEEGDERLLTGQQARILRSDGTVI